MAQISGNFQMESFLFHRYMGKSNKLALLLDFDGTLAPLVAHPSLSKMDPESEVALRSILNNSNVYVAIISGRSADDARKIAKLDGITYAGNHGLEIVFVNKPRYNHQLDEQTRENFLKIVEELQTIVSQYICPIHRYLCTEKFDYIHHFGRVKMELGWRIRSSH